jgi:hypothetical protein
MKTRAGYTRPRCSGCGKWYKFIWDTETFVKQCSCPNGKTPKKENKE